ncbi:hypothetical protein BUALT_Bualt18G0117700 [Buddleja alternifolia]|uniref:Peptidase A1 domain-containing protein n=1 Tax=Buddleja alternifolia TaxID=168488 RepID=A0AAV6WF38_9LAMI|nr:hypothetical protein BUALT_Bualt18G0117700 [Buddleja alternifolia]
MYFHAPIPLYIHATDHYNISYINAQEYIYTQDVFHSLFLVFDGINSTSSLGLYFCLTNCFHTIQSKNRVPGDLRRVDSDGNFTKSELLQRAMKRGRKRIERLNSMATLAASNVDIDAPVHAGGGEFLMDLSIGTPPMPFSAILDTGSDLIWTQCQPCIHCINQQTPIFDPNESSSFSKLPCSSDLCKALPQSRRTSSNCEYLYQYDGGAGLVGLGRGQLSLVAQLDEPKFSYCLKSIDSKTSTLFMGSRASTTSGDSIITTPLIKNPSPSLSSFYYISLKGISVGKTLLPIDSSAFEIKSDGSGGMIIDSGTALTYLEKSVFDLVKEEFSKQTQSPITQGPLEFCFTLPPGESFNFPTLTFHFEGQADLELSPENYLIIRVENGLGCLAMGSSKSISMIFGNIMHHNMLVLYDLAQETLSFVPKHCTDD